MAYDFEEIAKAFREAVDKDKEVQKILQRVSDGDHSYANMTKLAKRVGTDLGRVLKAYEPVDGIGMDDFIEILPKSLGLDHQIITNACQQVQENKNKEIGLNLKYQEPKFNMNRVRDLATELRNNPEFNNINKTFYDQLVNFSESIVDDSIRENAKLLYQSGVRTLVVRQAEAGCCEWCQEVAGTYDYRDAPTGADVWRRHLNCDCIIDFITEREGQFYTERVNNYRKK